MMNPIKRLLRSAWWLAVLALLVALLPGALLASDTPGLRQQPAPDPATDWQRVQSAETIVVGVAADYPPFEFYNSNFELDGFDIALMNALGAQMGVKVEFKDFAFDGLINALQVGQIDAAISAISVTPERRQAVDFTNLYYIGNSVALASTTFTETINSATDMAGLRVGVQRGTTYHAWVQQNLVEMGLITQDDLVTYSTPSEMVRDVRAGAIDVALLGEATAELAAERNDDLHLVGVSFNQQQLAIAASNGSSLIEPLNQALIALQSDGTFADLVRQYLQVSPNSVTPDDESSPIDNTPSEPPAVITPAPCVTSMAFIEDLTYDDHNMTAPPVMTPGEDFVKSWRILNNGTCDWAADYALVYVRGNRIEASMNGSTVPVGRTVRPGETIDLSAALRAPQVPGVFQGFWQMRDNLGQYFGEVVWVGIQVADPNPPSPPPPPTTNINPNLRADASFISAGQCTNVRWDVDNVRAVFFIDGGNQQGVGGHDTRSVCPGGTTTYTLRVIDVNGGQHDFPITITVSGAPDYSINFWADTTNLNGGQCTTLRWDVRNVQAVYLNGEGVAGVSSREVCPGNTQTYTLSVVKQDGGQDSRQVTINVNSPPPPPSQPPVIRQFTVDSNQIPRGSCVNFQWQTDQTQGVNLLRNGGAIVAGGPSSGSAQDCPDSDGLYEYRLVAYGVGQTEQTLTVNVMGPMPR
jgi:ABC-type amino acid transport substrate-binding protein